ncbi:MAG: type I methionyl aminopeptidase [bacterium]
MKTLIKTEEQIKGIRKSCHILADIFSKITADIKPGTSTGELEDLACRLIQQAGGKPAFKGYQTDKTAKPFPTALCLSINHEIVHAPAYPSRELKSGDIIGIDVGMEYPSENNKPGYFSDMARTIIVGEVEPETRRLVEVTKEALARGLAQIKPNNTLNDIGQTIQEYVESEGFAVVRDLVGHGVGLAVHEEPQIPHYKISESGLPDIKLKPGMVLAIEPMVNIGDWHIKTGQDGFTFETEDGSLSAHFEDTVLVTEDGHEILTR